MKYSIALGVCLLATSLTTPTNAQLKYAVKQIVKFNGENGSNPVGGLVMDSTGNLYGTTQWGGANGKGTLFKVAAGTNALSTLGIFDGTNGSKPAGSLTIDGSGNLYGTTVEGGANNYGAVFKFDVGTHSLETLTSFDISNGASPRGSLIADPNGNLYGVTQGGGIHGNGTVFKVANDATHTFTTLALFEG